MAWHTCWHPRYLYSIWQLVLRNIHTHISILAPPGLLSFTGISQLNEFCMKKHCPQRVCYGLNSHSVTRALWPIPTLNNIMLFPIYAPTMIKAEKVSHLTVNISKCPSKSAFCVVQTVFPDAFIMTYFQCRIWNSWCHDCMQMWVCVFVCVNLAGCMYTTALLTNIWL